MADIDDIINTIIAEAAGEGEEGMRLVGEVIRNRSRERGLSPGDVVRQKKQFTGFSNPGPAAKKAQDNPAIRAIAEAAWEASAGPDDPTKGGQFYWNPEGVEAMTGKRDPYWADDEDKFGRMTSGGHVFLLGPGAQGGVPPVPAPYRPRYSPGGDSIVPRGGALNKPAAGRTMAMSDFDATFRGPGMGAMDSLGFDPVRGVVPTGFDAGGMMPVGGFNLPGTVPAGAMMLDAQQPTLGMVGGGDPAMRLPSSFPMDRPASRMPNRRFNDVGEGTTFADVQNFGTNTPRPNRRFAQPAEMSPGLRTFQQAGSPFPRMPFGMTTPGTIDLNNRPVVRNADGSISTLESFSFNEDGDEVLVPMVAPNGGKFPSEDAAIAYYRQSGQHLGKFKSPEAATRLAQSLHEGQQRRYGDGIGLPPTTRTVQSIPMGPGVNTNVFETGLQLPWGEVARLPKDTNFAPAVEQYAQTLGPRPGPTFDPVQGGPRYADMQQFLTDPIPGPNYNGVPGLTSERLMETKPGRPGLAAAAGLAMGFIPGMVPMGMGGPGDPLPPLTGTGGVPQVPTEGIRVISSPPLEQRREATELMELARTGNAMLPGAQPVDRRQGATLLGRVGTYQPQGQGGGAQDRPGLFGALGSMFAPPRNGLPRTSLFGGQGNGSGTLFGGGSGSYFSPSTQYQLANQGFFRGGAQGLGPGQHLSTSGYVYQNNGDGTFTRLGGIGNRFFGHNTNSDGTPDSISGD